MKDRRTLPPPALMRTPRAGDHEIRAGAFQPAHVQRQEGKKDYVADAGREIV